ncbi:MAG: hypothetical protein ACJZZ7_05110 [Cytophagales bacterium]
MTSLNSALFITNLHIDPASDITGDANGDGTRDASKEDEFVELVNTWFNYCF